MRRCTTSLLALLFALVASAQDETPRTDSLDSATVVLNQRITEIEDSINRLRLKRLTDQNEKSLTQFLADYKEQKEAEQRGRWLRIAAVVLFALALLYGIARKRRMRRR